MRMMTLALVGLLLVACAEDPAMAPEERNGEEQTQGEQTAEGAMLEGTLGGDAQLEGGCAWLDAADGRYEVQYPDGFEIAFDPLRLVGPDGDTVAEEGDTVRVDGQVAEHMMSICQVGTIFQATEVLAGA